MTIPNVIQFPNTEKTLTIMTNFINAVALTDVGHPPYQLTPATGKHKGIHVRIKKGSKPFFVSMKEYMDLNITDDQLWEEISTKLNKAQ